MKSFSLIFLRFYVKLQDAYAAESNKLGTWTDIGYTAPGTKQSGGSFKSNVFEYSGDMTAATELTTEGAAPTGDEWKAAALTALNDCPSSANWTINVTGKTTGVTYVNGYSHETECKPLTPSFENIGTKAASTTTGG